VEVDYLLELSGGHPRSLALLQRLLKTKVSRPLAQLEADWRREVTDFVEHVPWKRCSREACLA
jgi:hypothetical protein